jgi:hypothetical protein
METNMEDENEIHTVHVLTYSHKHGTDVSVYATHDGALLSIYEIVMDYINDVEDREKRREIREAVKERNLARVSELWADAMNEGFDIDECAVYEGGSSDSLDAAIKASEEKDDEGSDEVLCEECGLRIVRDASEGVWVHGSEGRVRTDEDFDRDEDHGARPPEGTVW